jgi:hypothetical protein
MAPPISTQAHMSRRIECRQAVYGRVFCKRRDALFDTLDALLSSATVASFASLSQSERVQRT